MRLNIIFLVILVSILVLPIVNAEVNLSPFSSSLYNLGDKILVQGSIVRGDDVRVNMNLVLNCGSNSVQVMATLLNLKAGQKSDFSNFVTLPTNSVGKCKFVVDLVDLNGSLLESKEMGAFDLSSELKASFDINKNQFQLGEELLIKGTVTKQNGLVADGVLVLSFKQGGKVLFLDTVEVKGGLVDYKKSLSRITPGEYLVDVLVKDNLGNSKTITNLFNLNIIGNLNINSMFDKNIYSPGDTLNLNGGITSGFNKELTNLNLQFNFENEVKNKKLSSGKEVFNIAYAVPSRIKTGSHKVTIVASDDEGNYASKTVEFNVLAIPTVLNLNLESGSYDPEQNVEFGVVLLDQAGDQMFENVHITLYDVKGDVVDSKIVRTGTKDSILLPKYAKPGSWKLAVEGLGLNNQALFYVREYKKLDANLEGTSLFVENIGNVPYKDVFNIESGDLIKSKNLNLKVGEKQEIKLDKLFSSGVYNFSLPSIGKYFDYVNLPEKKSIFSGLFGDNKISGNVVKNTSGTGRRVLLFTALIVLFVSCGYLIFIFENRKKNQKFDFSNDRNYMLGQKKLDELRSKGIRKDPPMRYGKATKEDVEDWKKRIQENIKEHERMTSQNEFVRQQQKNANDTKPGMFNMFG